MANQSLAYHLLIEMIAANIDVFQGNRVRIDTG
jgi:hypothetical protein